MQRRDSLGSLAKLLPGRLLQVLDSWQQSRALIQPGQSVSLALTRREGPVEPGYVEGARYLADAGAEELSIYILVVDDEPDVEHLFRQQFRRDLRSGRFVMEFAASALEALERAKAIADPLLILILSDINMPGMSGLEMLPKVKSARPNVPVIMITAYGDESTRKKAAALGAAGLLTKPIDFGLLREEIDQRLQNAA